MGSSVVGLFCRSFVVCLAAVVCANVSFAQKRSAGPAKQFYDQGVEKMETGECREAIKLFSTAIEHRPNYANAFMYRGQCYFTVNEYEGSLADLNAAIKLDPKLDEAFKLRGDLFSTIGKFREAIADYTRMLRLEPNDHDTLMARAAAYREIGDNVRAAADERKADKIWESIVSDPDSVSPIMRIEVAIERPKLLSEAELIDSYVTDSTGGERLVSGSPDERRASAVSEVERQNSVIKANPEFAAAYFERGNAHVALGDHESSISDYSRAIALDPKFYKAFNNRAVACARTGNYERAVADLARAMTYKPKEQHRYYNFGLVLFNQTKYQMSVNILDGYLERNSGAFRAHQLRALAYRKLGKTAAADADEAAAKRLVEGK